MKAQKPLRFTLVVVTCLGMALPRLSLAGDDPLANLSIPVSKKIENIQLDANGNLRGAIVDANGRPIADAPVVIGVNGKPIAKLRTDREGRFRKDGLKQGFYQVVSHAGAHHYRVWEPGNAPAGVKQGVIHVAGSEVARGAGYSALLAILSNPVFLAALVSAAIVIPIAIDDEDAS